jgi:hypothetical protein
MVFVTLNDLPIAMGLFVTFIHAASGNGEVEEYNSYPTQFVPHDKTIWLPVLVKIAGKNCVLNRAQSISFCQHTFRVLDPDAYAVRNRQFSQFQANH